MGSRNPLRARLKAHLLCIAAGLVSGLAVGGLAVVLLGAFFWPSYPQQSTAPPTPEEQAAQAAQECAAALAEMRERVQPLPATRPFDMASLRARPTVSPESEVRALLDDLEAVRENKVRDAAWGAVDRTATAAERLALFRWRFGVDAPSVEGWELVKAQAIALLAEADAEADEDSFQLNLKSSYDALLEAQLLELAGRTAEAAERLAGIEVQHFCGNCAAERRSVVRQRQSEATLVEVGPVEALSILGDLCAFDFSGRKPFEIETAHEGAWLGVLLLANDRSEHGVLVLQQVVDLFPGTAGAEVAWAALDQVGALIEPSSERLERVYIQPADGANTKAWSPRQRQLLLATAALGRYRSVDSLDRLVALWREGHVAALRGLSELGDELARPLLEEVVSNGEFEHLATALTGLRALPGGVLRKDVDTALRRMRDTEQRWGWSALADLDAFLRSTYGGGPVLRDLDKTLCQDFARDWLAWLEPDMER